MATKKTTKKAEPSGRSPRMAKFREDGEPRGATKSRTKQMLVAPTAEEMAEDLWPAMVVCRALGVGLGSLRSAILGGRVPGERLPTLMGTSGYKRLMVRLGAYIRQLERTDPRPINATEALKKLVALWERDTKRTWPRAA